MRKFLQTSRMPGRWPMARTQWLQIAAISGFAVSLGFLMVIGIGEATRLQAAVAALKVATELGGRPEVVRSELTLMQRGLESRTYVGRSFRNLASLRQGIDQSFGALQSDLQAAGLDSGAPVTAALAAARAPWQAVDARLVALEGFHDARLYADTASGSELTAAGNRVKSKVDELLSAPAGQSGSLTLAARDFGEVGEQLRLSIVATGQSLRALLLAGSAVFALLLALIVYFAYRSRRLGLQASSAHQQVSSILETVREGLFLIGRDLRLGQTCSTSLTTLLRTQAPAGQDFEELLRPLVDDRTFKAAAKFIALLWKEKVHEDLIESINPLSQVEVSFTGPDGRPEVRFLSFSFRRVRGQNAAADYLLGVVSDITDRIQLARELEHARGSTESQTSLLFELMRIDPGQLRACLANADAAFRKSNALLQTPGHEHEALLQKVDGVFRELHAVKGEASAIGLSHVVQRIHAIENLLSGLRTRQPLSGSDFLPIVTQLDELIGQASEIQILSERLAGSLLERSLPAPQAEEDSPSHGDTDVLERRAFSPAPALPMLGNLLRSLAGQVAANHGCSVKVLTQGLELVPARHATAVRNICVQMVRNAVVHGIERTQDRLQAGKNESGTIRISFTGDSADHYLLTIDDDGRGLNYEQILDHALRLGLVRPQQAASLERRQVYGLIFRPGFTTATEVTEHAGRGAGLDVVSALVRELGGQIGVSTASGKYTRFMIQLPKADAAPLAAPSVA
jgi:two-component sensor histidine kinase/PAS domain-containing protein/HPt (histidine-containing phosphotransfer) domain-containing protein